MAAFKKMNVLAASVIQNNVIKLVGHYLFYLSADFSLLHNSFLSRRTLCANGHNAYQMRKPNEKGPMRVSPEAKQGYKSVYTVWNKGFETILYL